MIWHHVLMPVTRLPCLTGRGVELASSGRAALLQVWRRSRVLGTPRKMWWVSLTPHVSLEVVPSTWHPFLTSGSIAGPLVLALDCCRLGCC